MQKYLEIGQIVGTHGIKGFVRVKPLTDDIKRFDELKTVYIVGAGLAYARVHERCISTGNAYRRS